ncbi:fungal-specific transcription factor domain-containing protein [Mycena capillaripes]|nr:fungal-specific transcription factor domain-containing protein [Mycena capillaripes]
MSEANDDLARSGVTGKRRRLPGACDACRRRKVRCDSAQMAGQRCTSCAIARIECTHGRLQWETENQAPQQQYAPGVKTGRDYVESILSTSVVYIPSNDPAASHRILVEVAQYARGLERQLAAFQASSSAGDSPSESSSCEAPPSPTARYLGKSSTMQFVNSAVKHMHHNPSYVANIQKSGLWATETQPWEDYTTQRPQHSFPDDDLLHILVNIYFDQINPLSGILHFPTFRDSLANGLHTRDPHFGAVVLVVCASASRYSSDPRVFIDGATEHSCGWKWFRQVRPLRTSFSPQPSLYQLQLICLSVLYISSMSKPEECWTLAGLGIRVAQAAGAHQRSGYTRMAPLEAEQYKRVYWILVTLDSFMGLFQGRPGIASYADVDLDFPIDLEDEYQPCEWTDQHPTQRLQKPCTSAFLGAYLRMVLIFARIPGAVYPGDGKTCSPDAVADLIADLNGWVELIPDHLRWDPAQENQIFLDQSVILYTAYYHAQILIHRPFIQTPGKEAVSNTINFPSLAICANAARACGRVLDLHARRGRGLLPHANVMTALFDSAIVILINVWAVVGGARARTTEEFNRATADAQNCVRVLRLYERRFRVAGRKCDIISMLLNLGKNGSVSDGPRLKRPRDADAYTTPEPDAKEDTGAPSKSNEPSRADVHLIPSASSSGILSVEEEVQALQQQLPAHDQQLFGNGLRLPLHTEELGRLPVYESFDHDNMGFLQPGDVGQSEMQFDIGYADFPSNPGMYNGVDALASMLDCYAPQSFGIPSGAGWRDWCTYLENVEELSTRSAYL